MRVAGPSCPSPTSRKITVQRDPLSLQKSSSRDQFVTEEGGKEREQEAESVGQVAGGADGPWLSPKLQKEELKE